MKTLLSTILMLVVKTTLWAQVDSTSTLYITVKEEGESGENIAAFVRDPNWENTHLTVLNSEEFVERADLYHVKDTSVKSSLAKYYQDNTTYKIKTLDARSNVLEDFFTIKSSRQKDLIIDLTMIPQNSLKFSYLKSYGEDQWSMTRVFLENGKIHTIPHEDFIHPVLAAISADSNGLEHCFPMYFENVYETPEPLESQIDTVLIHDTITQIKHDTITLIDTQIVHDTITTTDTLTLYDTIVKTEILTELVTVHDTVFMNNCPEIPDSTNTTAVVNGQESGVSTVYAYPNPASTTLKIKNITANADFSIHDISGRIILTGTLNPDHPVISIDDFPDGLYFIHILNGNTKFVVKFSKE